GDDRSVDHRLRRAHQRALSAGDGSARDAAAGSGRDGHHRGGGGPCRTRGPPESAIRPRRHRRAAASVGVHQLDRAAHRRRPAPPQGALSDRGRAGRHRRPRRDLPDPVADHARRRARPLSARGGCMWWLYNGGTLRRPGPARLVSTVFALAVVALATAGAPAQDKTRTPTAVITMEKGGEIVLEFFPKDAPKHVENFLTLAKKKFYDGQRVHRVDPGFVVQFGDPQSKTKPMDDPSMGSGGPGYTIKAEFNSRKFERGTLGMARTDDPNSAGSQVYIMLGPAPFLDGKY